MYHKINEFYAIERNLEGLEPEEKHKQRQERLKPALDVSFLRLETVNASSGTKLSKTVKYAMNEKKYLYRFLESPYVPIDNNRAENAIRPFVAGRKNWLFSNTQNGTKASADIYSIVETAKANRLDVFKYFELILTVLSSMEFLTNPDILEELMPWNESVHKICKTL